MLALARQAGKSARRLQCQHQPDHDGHQQQRAHRELGLRPHAMQQHSGRGAGRHPGAQGEAPERCAQRDGHVTPQRGPHQSRNADQP